MGEAASKSEKAIASINGEYKYGFSDKDASVFRTPKGLSHDIVEQISAEKNEPEWMRKFRHKALDYFYARPLPAWGADLSGIDFDAMTYYVKPTDRNAATWEDLPPEMRETWNKLGIPEAEQKSLAGVGATYDSTSVYHSIQKHLEDQGVIFMDTDSALREHEELFKKYFATVVPANDNLFAALNSAVWSGGSFLYVPPGVHIEMPVEQYFRINSPNFSQAERTLIIADEGSSVHYLEGCSAPSYSADSLHSAVVELIALKGAEIKYTTLQSWYKNVYNLVTKRAVAYEKARVAWLDINLGSQVTMKYPGIFLVGEGAQGEVHSIALATTGQHQDTGAKIVHAAPNTTSLIVAKSISKGEGRSTYRGLLEIAKGAKGSKSKVVCDALLLDTASRTDTYPTIRVYEDDVDVGHEATVSKVGEEMIFYLMSRGLTEEQATAMIVNGFVEDIVKRLPLEHAVEFTRLVEIEMEGSVG